MSRITADARRPRSAPASVAARDAPNSAPREAARSAAQPHRSAIGRVETGGSPGRQHSGQEARDGRRRRGRSPPRANEKGAWTAMRLVAKAMSAVPERNPGDAARADRRRGLEQRTAAGCRPAARRPRAAGRSRRRARSPTTSIERRRRRSRRGSARPRRRAGQVEEENALDLGDHLVCTLRRRHHREVVGLARRRARGAARSTPAHLLRDVAITCRRIVHDELAPGR